MCAIRRVATVGGTRPEEIPITAITAALLAASLAADPVPDNKTIDSLSYTFSTGSPAIGASGHLTIAADGKVSYSHATAPFTGSGGIVTQKSWEIPKDELAELFRKLVAAGLLDMPADKTPSLFNQFRVTSGRWHMSFPADPMPEKVMTQLRPVLAKAHPGLWAEKPAAKDPLAAAVGKVTILHYSFTQKAEGEQATLTLNRDGTVIYQRQTHSNAPGGIKMLVNETWKLPAKDAEALLDALVADGLFDLEDTRGGKFPNHAVYAQSGRWRTTLYPKELSEKVAKHLRPLLQKADRELWK